MILTASYIRIPNHIITMSSSHNFMLKEYEQMARVYGDLLIQKNDLLKFYAGIIGAGGTAVTLLNEIMKKQQVSVVILLFLIGTFIFSSLIGIRMEMILYIRAINAVRGFFVVKDRKDEKTRDYSPIVGFLVLPHYDQDAPPYLESSGTWFFWTIILVGMINSGLAVLGSAILVISDFYNLGMRIIILPLLVLLGIIIHYYIYRFIALKREEVYITKRHKSKENIGNY